ERLVHDRHGAAQVLQRAWKARDEPALRHVVASLRDTLPHAPEGDSGILEADEDERHEESRRARPLQEVELRAERIGEHRLGAEPEAQLEQVVTEPLGLIEGPLIEIALGQIRMSLPQNPGD